MLVERFRRTDDYITEAQRENFVLLRQLLG